MTVETRTYTADDLWTISHLPENDGRRFRLIEGELREMAPTGLLHGQIAARLLGRLFQHVDQHGLGVLTAAETGFVLSSAAGKNTVLAPDVGFISEDRVPDEITERYFALAPDLACEVVSPSNTDAEMSSKVEQYLRNGTQMVWIVYPQDKKVHVYRRTQEGNQANVQFLGIDEVLDGGDVVPGFTLPLRDLFARPS